MAFVLNVSNSLDELAAQLCIDMQQQKFTVFQPITVVTQTEGMNNWLKLKIAGNLGIAANINFVRPNELINNIYKILGEKFEPTLDRETITWHLYTELGSEIFAEKFPLIAAYFIDDSQKNDVKRMGLAQKLADLFDQYQVYRADMVLEWNEGSESAGTEWQQYLWQQLKNKLGKTFADKTEIGKSISNALSEQNKADRLASRMPVIYFFGISIFTAYHLQILENVARHINVHFLLLNPAPGDYWFEEMPEKKMVFLKQIKKLDASAQSQGNALLLSWGSLLQTTYTMLFQHEDILNGYEELPGTERDNDSLLHHIQNEVFSNKKEAGQYITKDILQDHSLVINSCFTAFREVEAFYNYLVYLLHEKQVGLKPTDIIVLVSDVDLYAPYIRAVFDHAPTKFRYAIADENVAASDGVLQALESLLQLRETHFTAENIIRLLDSSVLKTNFGITDISLVRTVIDAANIRFGISNNVEDESLYVSWKYGMKRIMYGIAMSGSEEYGSGAESFFPLDIIEGSKTKEITSFVHLAEILIEMVQEKHRDRTVAEWVNFVQEIVEVFLGIEADENEELAYLQEKLESYNEAAASFTEKISFDVFLQNFETGVMNDAKQQQFLQGGITFCSLIPMRSIPFKLVAMLGLNFNSFPRKEKPVSFDLMLKNKRKGDRNIKENDKHLFLETLLSAEEYFYLSYIGQHSTTLAETPPSAVIDELLSYIKERFIPELEGTEMVIKHPLYSYSKRYNQHEYGLYNYLGDTGSSLDVLGEQKTVMQTVQDEISIQQFIKFLLQPVDGYYHHVLNIYYDETEPPLADTEVFDMDHLQKWNVKSELVALPENQITEWENTAKKQGRLPLKNSGTIAVQVLEETIEPVRKSFREITEGAEATAIEINIVINDRVISGTLKNVYADSLVVVSLSRNELKYILRAYLQSLLIAAMDLPLRTVFISNEGIVYTGELLSKDEAITRLTKLKQLYTTGHNRIIPFSTDLKIDIEKYLEDAEKAYNDMVSKTFTIDRSPCHNQYLVKAYRDGLFDHGLETFSKWAEELLIPLKEFLPTYYE